jgi:hypothetical protein
MTLRNIGSNQTEITKADGTTILYSYSTPVAAHVPGKGYLRTRRHFSVTTSKHINKWIAGTAEVIDHEELEAIAN